MADSIVQRYVRGTVCALVVIPAVFLAAYPLLTAVLPERMAILRDLPQDLTLVLILDGILVPLLGVVLYVLARRRGETPRGGGPPSEQDTRDAF